MCAWPSALNVFVVVVVVGGGCEIFFLTVVSVVSEQSRTAPTYLSIAERVGFPVETDVIILAQSYTCHMKQRGAARLAVVAIALAAAGVMCDVFVQLSVTQRVCYATTTPTTSHLMLNGGGLWLL